MLRICGQNSNWTMDESFLTKGKTDLLISSGVIHQTINVCFLHEMIRIKRMKETI